MPATNSRPERAATWLQPDQIQRLRTACYDESFQPRFRQRNEAIVTLLYDVGLRVGELVELDVDQLNLEITGTGMYRVTDTIPDGDTTSLEIRADAVWLHRFGVFIGIRSGEGLEMAEWHAEE